MHYVFYKKNSDVCCCYEGKKTCIYKNCLIIHCYISVSYWTKQKHKHFLFGCTVEILCLRLQFSLCTKQYGKNSKEFPNKDTLFIKCAMNPFIILG